MDDAVGDLISAEGNELTQRSMCLARSAANDSSYGVDDVEGLDLVRVSLSINPRYSLVIFGDASFANGELKQSVTGFVIYLNGVPLIWGSLKQTIVVDSSCSAEFVAASVACKKLIHAENMLGF